MPLRQSRGVLVACGIAVLCSLTACVGYTPTPGPDGTALGSVPGAAAPEAADPFATPVEEEPDTSTWQTKWGPLSETDRELIRKVRLASLWEMPMAQDAVQHASNARVREVSAEIAAQHHTLDEQARELADKLQVKLPVRPTSQQEAWMKDISSRTGAAYDTTYIKWLRLAHGQIFPLIGAVRGSTQNTLVRRFSEQCNAAVLNHQRLLESTELTSPESFPTPSG